jgi:hypothetical protein
VSNNNPLAGTGKDYRQFVRAILSSNPGAKLVNRGGKHYRIEHPTLPPLTVAGSPSDWRSIRNAKAQARRAGYVVR